MRPVIVVFAKAPVPGRVKTRLSPPLSATDAARLHEAFVLDTIARWRTSAELELHTDVDWDAWHALGVTMRRQTAGDLGPRLLNAFHQLQRPALILGADSPNLPVAHHAPLLDSAADVTLGPSDDGGYYAIHARRTHPAMFEGVRWSTPHALRDTVHACQLAGLSVALGPGWFDVDDAASLRRLMLGNDVPPATAAALATMKVPA
jgi:rSAM/selenodomain-associated transferase 1